MTPTGISRTLPKVLLILAAVVGTRAEAQTPPVSDARLDTRRAQATRAELQATLLQIDSILASPGYSGRIRDAKRREAALIKQRLADGDLLVGDQLVLMVVGEPALSDTFNISSGQVLILPGVAEIPLRGVLRSEAQGYLTRELGKMLRDPSVRVESLIRLSVLGAVGRQGFYQIPADVLVSDAIMAAGGPIGSADPNKTIIRRGGTTLLAKEEVRDAIVRGSTLDQLNLRAGDEIVVDAKQVQRGRSITLLTVTTLLTTTIYFATMIF